MEIKKLSRRPVYKEDDLIKVSEMGNVIEVQYMKFRPEGCPIVNLPLDSDGKRRYIIKDTGEVKECMKHDSRKDSYKSLHRTFKHLRELVNSNVSSPKNVRWITLTYAENMTDTERLYEDFKLFNMRFQYWLKVNGYSKAEYIVVCEPQGRGAWHMHLMYIWDVEAPFIANERLAELWGHGFVKVKALQDCDNVGSYLTAYLGDIEIEVDVSPLSGCGI